MLTRLIIRNFKQLDEVVLALRKSDYPSLARLVPKGKLDTEVREKLDQIATVASQATPQQGCLRYGHLAGRSRQAG